MALFAALATPAQAQATQRVNLSSSGAQASHRSFYCSISADGRFVAFDSLASNLVNGDTNGVSDVFVHDRANGHTQRVSVAMNGFQGNDASRFPSMSADARFVVFESDASNFGVGDPPSLTDLFVRDRQLGTTELINVDSAGIPSNQGVSTFTAISADGRYVAFNTGASDLVSGDTNGKDDVFVRDRQLGITERVSLDSSSGQILGGWGNEMDSISANGRYVLFESFVDNVVAGDTNGNWDVFVRDRLLGTTERVSVGTAGLEANDRSGGGYISDDGRFVVFSSYATNLVAGDTNGEWDVFLRDRLLDTTERVSVDSASVEGDEGGVASQISPDGRFVLFYSYSTNLVLGDTNGEPDVFVRDLQLGTIERLSLSSTGGEGNDGSGGASLTPDGRFMAFGSAATNLVPGDTNGFGDIFVRDREYSLMTSLCDPGVGGVAACPCGNPASGANRGCDNSASTGGASLTAAGGAFLSSDSVVFTTTGEKPTATSVLLQGTSSLASGAIYGQGVRCVGGTLKRLFTKAASGGSITAPNFGAGDPSVSARSAAKGNPISAGQSRWYLVFYRDPIVLGGCPSGSTFNATQTGQVTWSP